jgi:hypothetical protein
MDDNADYSHQMYGQGAHNSPIYTAVMFLALITVGLRVCCNEEDGSCLVASQRAEASFVIAVVRHERRPRLVN